MNARSLAAAGWMAAAIASFTLAVLEISFPSVFSLAFRFDALLRYRMHLGIGEVVVSGLLLWPAFRMDRALAEKILETACRLGLGGMFVSASWFKVQDPQGFALLVAQYQFLPQSTVNLFALFMPQLELWTGLALVATRWNREASVLLLAMFGAFVVALAQAVWRDLGITCGCFEIDGALDKKEAWIALVRDLILIAPTVWLTTRPNRTLLGVWRGR